MNLYNPASCTLDLLESVFSKQHKPIRRNLALTVLSLIKGESSSLTDVALEMGRINNKDFNTNEKRVTRFIDSKNFQIDDKLWREYLKLTFKLLSERSFEFDDRKIAINVDFTSKADKFAILSASLPFEGRGIPLYFSMRVYPKGKDSFNQKKMEEAFIKELRHLLPKHYQYTIVADRGFGNGRFVSLCEENGFSYIIRTKDDFRILSNNFSEEKKVRDFCKNDLDFPNAIVVPWNKEVRLIKVSNNGSKWHIVTNLVKAQFEEITSQYGDRFKCEKMFQDEKSSGFDIEKSKIRKYERFKRLLFCVTCAQMLMMFVGDYINNNVGDLKKKFYYHLNLISVFSS